MSGVGVRKIGVFLDIDGTLMNTGLESVDDPWIGGDRGKELIVGYLNQWTRRAQETGCELHFGVITNKQVPDSLVFAVLGALESFLDLNHPYAHGNRAAGLGYPVESWTLSVQFRGQIINGRHYIGPIDLDPSGRLTGRNHICAVPKDAKAPYEKIKTEILKGVSPKVIMFMKPGLTCPGLPRGLPKESYEGYQNKADAMAHIARDHGIAPKDCYLVDDRKNILEEVSAAGMNPVSAECFSFLSQKGPCEDVLRSWYDGVNQEAALDKLNTVFGNLSQQLEAKYFGPAELEKAKLEKAELEKSTGCAGAGSGLSPASSESFESVEIEGEDVKSPGAARVFYEILYAHGFNKAELDAEIYSAALGIFAK